MAAAINPDPSTAFQLFAQAGHHAHWGFSSHFDMLEALVTANVLDATNAAKATSSADTASVHQPIRILLAEPADIRHILAIISKRRRNKLIGVPIEIYLLENTLELLAREVLLLEVLNDFEVPIRQRASIFLEIFGNALVQERTNRYIEQLSIDLRSLFANNSGRLESLIDFSLLKYREKDQLEECFKNYNHNYIFDMSGYRDHRLRGLLMERYDARASMSDWDYHESIRSRASIIHIKQFKDWRLTGIAIEFGDQKYTEPNRTLMSFTEGTMKGGKEKGLKKEIKGYWGDIVSSPFFSFGVDSETPNKFAENLYEIYNKNHGAEQHRHHTVELCVYNMLSLLWEMETGTQYVMTKDHDIYSGLGREARLQPLPPSQNQSANEDAIEPVPEEEVLIETTDPNEKEKSKEEKYKEDAAKAVEKPPNVPYLDDESCGVSSAIAGGIAAGGGSSSSNLLEEEELLAQSIRRAECIVESLSGLKIIPMKGPASTVLSKTKFESFFDAAFLSCRCVAIMGDEFFPKILKERALVAVETAKFFVPLGKAGQKKAFVEKINEMAAKQNLRSIPPPVFRRRRDELDLDDDVAFFTR